MSLPGTGQVPGRPPKPYRRGDRQVCSLRFKEAWQQRTQRRALANARRVVENDLLAAADQAERQKWVDRDRDPKTWTAAMLDELWWQTDFHIDDEPV